MNTISLTFKQIFNAVEQKMNKKLEEFDLTTAQLHILMFLFKNSKNNITQRDIESKFCLSNPTVNGILNRLENKNFIIRKKSQKDARYKEIYLTKKGEDVFDKMKNHAMLKEEDILKNVTPEDLVILKKVLNQILDNIKEEKE